MDSFRCHAYGSGERWHGICTDLDIAVDGRSLRKVKATLETCVDMYLESIADLPANERKRFLRRRAPQRVRVWSAMSTWLYRLTRAGARSAQSFLLQSHVAAPS